MTASLLGQYRSGRLQSRSLARTHGHGSREPRIPGTFDCGEGKGPACAPPAFCPAPGKLPYSAYRMEQASVYFNNILPSATRILQFSSTVVISWVNLPIWTSSTGCSFSHRMRPLLFLSST